MARWEIERKRGRGLCACVSEIGKDVGGVCDKGDEYVLERWEGYFFNKEMFMAGYNNKILVICEIDFSPLGHLESVVCIIQWSVLFCFVFP